jgi:hypothetical protein
MSVGNTAGVGEFRILAGCFGLFEFRQATCYGKVDVREATKDPFARGLEIGHDSSPRSRAAGPMNG